MSSMVDKVEEERLKMIVCVVKIPVQVDQTVSDQEWSSVSYHRVRMSDSVAFQENLYKIQCR